MLERKEDGLAPFELVELRSAIWQALLRFENKNTSAAECNQEIFILMRTILQKAVSKARFEQLIEARRVLGTGLDNFKKWIAKRILAHRMSRID